MTDGAPAAYCLGMAQPLTRRTFGVLALSSAAAPALAATSPAELEQLEQLAGGRLGVFALDAATGKTLAWRADERFLMCSTFKTILAGAVLAEIDAGREKPDRMVPYSESDLLEYAPVTRAHVAEKGMTVDALCAAAVEMSDNTAANLLYPIVKGPEGLTKFTRKLGDLATRMDRTEPTANRPDGALDTTTPRAMAGTVRKLLTGEVLSRGARSRLEDWMIASSPGRERLRAGLPSLWRVGAKAGTGNTETNDVAIVHPTSHAPVFVTAYLESRDGGAVAAEAALKEVGRIVGVWV